MKDLTDRQSIFVEGLAIGICTCVLTPACWAPYQWVLLCAMGLLGAVRPNLGIRILQGPLIGSCELLVLLLGLSLLSHEGGENIQVRLLLGLEILCHGDIPIQAGLAGQLAYEPLERGRVVEDL